MLKKFRLEEIKKIEEIEYSGDVFDLEVEDDHTYTINDYQIVHNCSDAAHGLRGHIIADGGCKQPADVSKAFGAGADFVMLGSMLAGHDESGGEIISKWHRGNEVAKDIDGSHLGYIDEEKKFKEVYGMSSEYAMTKHYGKRDEYRASEGNYSLVEYKGPVKNTIEDILGGLRSACTYTGAENLKGLPRCTTFIRVNRIK